PAEVGGRLEAAPQHRLYVGVGEVAERAAAAAEQLDAAGVGVEPEDGEAALGKRPRQRQADVAEAHDADAGRPAADAGGQGGGWGGARGVARGENVSPPGSGGGERGGRGPPRRSRGGCANGGQPLPGARGPGGLSACPPAGCAGRWRRFVAIHYADSGPG